MVRQQMCHAKSAGFEFGEFTTKELGIFQELSCQSFDGAYNHDKETWNRSMEKKGEKPIKLSFDQSCQFGLNLFESYPRRALRTTHDKETCKRNTKERREANQALVRSIVSGWVESDRIESSTHESMTINQSSNQ
mmetsp:Transcript_1977/g.4459  ORF Transcript_1977/g.4459 Transcript_1977/m.4459 type:complete len:135 (+) Transcript_1977:749-1153(+)